MSNLSTGREFSLAPTTFAEAERFAKILSESDFVPKEFRGKPGNCLVAMQAGNEIGIGPTQSVQNIAVINGRPSIYGDAALAVVRAHPRFSSIEELDAQDAIAKGSGVCSITTRDGVKVTRRFSIDEAKKAGLWSKAGPWSQYPGRMLQMRARAFAMRDSMPEALKGIAIREEVEDIGPPVIATTKPDAPVQIAAVDVESFKAMIDENPTAIADSVGAMIGKEKETVPGEMSDDEKTLIGLRERIEAVETRAALAAIGAEIKDMSQAIRDAIKPAYAARYKELTQ
ncbi:MAG: hypothetical protein IPJ03_17245 [Ignavibacteriales bacterium]|nr:hypothetical protein [Ignavibacteriales bacterium]